MSRILKYIGYLLFLPFWWLQLLVPRKKNIWIFGAWYGNRFSDNSKYLYLYVKRNHPNIKAVWLTKDSLIREKVIQEGGFSYLTNSFMACYYSLLAKNIIVSSGKRDVNYLFINGAKKIQLWHGNPMKKIGLDDKNSNVHSLFQRRIVPIIFPFISEFNYDFVISNSGIFSEKMASAFNVSLSRILETGCPRNDIFYCDKTDVFNNELRKKFKGCKIIYYLPTFRNHIEAKSLFNLEDFDKSKINEFLEKENLVFVNKGHYVDNNLNGDIEDLNSRIISLSDKKVSDINFMLKDADLLVTDYSGAYFDYLLTEKPLIFAAFDLEEYKSSSREIYFNYEEIVAGPIVKDWSELMKSLQTIWGQEKYANLVKDKNRIFNKFHDSNNSKRVFESLLNIQK